MKAIILAAGYATRLWPLTLNMPKPLLPIGDKAMLEHIMEKLEAVKGIDEILIVTNSNFVKNFKEWKRSYKTEKKVSIIDDGINTPNQRRGAIGDVIFVIGRKHINSDTLVVAGDNIFDFGLEEFIKKGKANLPFATIGLFDIGALSLANKYGIVGLNGSNIIASFQEKPKNPKSTLAAMCLYYLPKRKLPLLKEYKDDGNPLDMAGSFISWLSERERVYGHTFKGVWFDIGDKKSLKQAQGIKWD
jgi:glucose-1-phosphate thymidylyltransferase